jgi:hypothetical protein
MKLNKSGMFVYLVGAKTSHTHGEKVNAPTRSTLAIGPLFKISFQPILLKRRYVKVEMGETNL